MQSSEADRQLAEKIRDTQPGDAPFREPLRTSERVIRRVTDGIYREPWAAIRELISNAYDADATRVVVSTDAPRFHRLTIRDNGNGFTAEALASMCHNIGGSPKRTNIGADLGVTAEDDPDLSPGGRRLIGKLGIGLFSVSQLTQQFRIITKVQGENSRTVADVILFRHTEPRKQKKQPFADEVETTGEVQITKIAADDIDAHGTDVVIDQLLPRTRDEFRSRDLWEMVLHPPTESEGGGSVITPAFHIGYTGGTTDTYEVPPNLPWQDDDNPQICFRKLTQAMFDRTGPTSAERRPSLKTAFDNYLRFVWLISLSVPIDCLDKHPFDITGADDIRVFQLGSMKKGKAKEIELNRNETVRQRLGLHAPERGGAPEFVVQMDDLELRRPVRFTSLPKTSNKLKTPLLFVGSAEPDTTKFDSRVTGGSLRFEGYLLWAPRVVPVEHNGALIRIGDASGSLFDETFMRYQISEQTRKEQVSAEIFVQEGMDAALNIDRESFNHAHPHYQYLAAWLHDAFKQFATKHKAIGSETRTQSLVASHISTKAKLDKLVEETVSRWTDDGEDPVDVHFVDQTALKQTEPRGAEALLLPDSILSPIITGKRTTEKKGFEFDKNKAKITAITQILYAAGLLDKLTPERRDQLLSDIAAVLFFRGEE